MDDDQYLDLALGLASPTPSTPLASRTSSSLKLSSKIVAPTPNASELPLHQLAFGSAAKQVRSKDSKKSSKKKQGKVMPDIIDVAESPLVPKTSNSTKRRKKKKRDLTGGTGVNGLRPATGSKYGKLFGSCFACASYVWRPFQRFGIYWSTKIKAFQYLYAFFLIAYDFLMSEANCRSGIIFVLFGLLLSIASEALLHAPRYNTMVMLAIMAAAKFPMFPVNTMRPQVTLVVLVTGSLALDIYHWILLPIGTITDSTLSAFICCIMVAKCFALVEFLSHGMGTSRARKYLIRRVRLFGLPCQVPKRLMREVRSRVVAIGLIELLSILVLAALFVLSITSFNYQVFYVSNTNVSMSTALFCKVLTTGIVIAGILFDTDIVLSAGYFGCLGFAMQYLKAYTLRKKKELGGWPYTYAFNLTRFQIVTAAKVIDVCIGAMTWIALSHVSWRGMASEIRAFVSFILLSMLVTDIWVPVLFVGAYWLLSKHQEMEEDEAVDDSDDSELDDLQVREKTEQIKSQNKAHLARREREMMQLEKWKKKERLKMARSKRASRYEPESDSGSSSSSSGSDSGSGSGSEDEEGGGGGRGDIETGGGGGGRNGKGYYVEEDWTPKVTLPTSLSIGAHQFSSRGLGDESFLSYSSQTSTPSKAVDRTHSGSDADRDSVGRRSHHRSPRSGLVAGGGVGGGGGGGGVWERGEEGGEEAVDEEEEDPEEGWETAKEKVRRRLLPQPETDYYDKEGGQGGSGSDYESKRRANEGEGERGEQEEEEELDDSYVRFQLDPSVEIEPIAFSHLWDTHEIGASFTCKIANKSVSLDQEIDVNAFSSSRHTMFELELLLRHLRNMGFCIIAAGTHADGFTKVYAFAATANKADRDRKRRGGSSSRSARGRSENNSSKISFKPSYFMAELKIHRYGDNAEAYIVDRFHNHHIFLMECVAKCTDDSLITAFVAELNFGDIFQLIPN